MDYNNPFQSFKNFFVSIFEGEKVEESDKLDNSKTEKVDNLQVKINNNYEPENRELDLSAEINDKLPMDVLKVAFSHLGFKDLDSASKVSRYWAEVSKGVVSYKEFFAVESFGVTLSEKIPPEKYLDLKTQMLEVTKMDAITQQDAVIRNNTTIPKEAHSIKNKEKFIQNMDEFIQNMFGVPQNTSLPDLKTQRNMLLSVRFKVIEILSKLEDADLLKLEKSFFLNKKPMLFDRVFKLAQLHAKFRSLDLSDWSSYPQSIIKDFCGLEALDIALNSLKNLGIRKGRYNDNYYSSVKCVADHLLTSGNFQKVEELVKITIDPTDNKGGIAIKEIVEMCIPLGKMDEGYALATKLSVTDLEKLKNLGPIGQKIKEKNFTQAIVLRNKSQNFSQAQQLIVKEFEQVCTKLIQEAKLDEVKNLVAACAKMSNDIVQPVYEPLAIGLIKAGRFDEAVECAELLDVIDRHHKSKLLHIIAALCEKGQLDQVEKIKEIQIKGDHNNNHFHRDSRYLMKCYEEMNNGKFDSAIHSLKNGMILNAMAPYLIRKLLDAKRNDEAIETFYLIKNTDASGEALKVIAEKQD